MTLIFDELLADFRLIFSYETINALTPYANRTKIFTLA